MQRLSTSLLLSLLSVCLFVGTAHAEGLRVPSGLSALHVPEVPSPVASPASAAARPLPDEVEPNNTAAQAQVLAPPYPVTVSGSAEVSDTGDLYFDDNNNGMLDPGEEDLEDLFRVTTTAPGLRLVLDGFTSDLDLYLINGAADSVIEGSAAVGTDPEEINLPDLTAGTYYVAVSIYDPAPGGPSTSSYTLSVQGMGSGTPPAVSHTPISGPVPAGAPQTVSATISDDGSVAAATLRYVVGGSGSPSEVSMTNTGGNTYEATIPGSALTARGLLYQIAAQDSEGATTTIPAGGFFSVRVRVDGGLNRSVATSGTSAAAYRLVSVPLALDNASPAAVLEDDLGEYDTEDWRFFSLRADQNYAEFPTGTMAPGRAFWLAVSASGQQWDTGAGTSVTLAEPYEIGLNAGWTFVATPFDFDVSRDFVRLASGGTPDVRFYSGGWNTYSGPFRPFEGYAVASQGSDALRILPNFDPAAARGQHRAGRTKGTGALAAQADAPAARSADEATWAIRIAAEAGEARDGDNLATVAAEASEGLDALDLPEPPVIGDYVRVAFPHEEWNSVFTHYSTDARPAPGAESTAWSFTVQTNVAAAVRLHFENLSDVPAAYDVWLVDEQTGSWQDLRANGSYRLAGVSATAPRTMRLVVGPRAAVEARRQQEQTLPQGFEVESYPNPFASVATVRYGLPEASRVRVAVYDLLGKHVATLVENEEQEAGYHTAVWEPQGLASGIYVYVLEAGTRRLTGKLSLVR